MIVIHLENIFVLLYLLVDNLAGALYLETEIEALAASHGWAVFGPG
jgi:hypothetical protein